ncbi:hypothetical protein KIPB_009695, partial [Kipferlia bialata]|eukprot:g9695.t1
MTRRLQAQTVERERGHLPKGEGEREAEDDTAFWFNYHISESLTSALTTLSTPSHSIYIPRVIRGFFQTTVVPLTPTGTASQDAPHSTLRMSLISRRSRHRAGTRYHRRGTDTRGYSANYAETEYVTEATLVPCASQPDTHHVSSMVIVRGSAAVPFKQAICLRYKPTVTTLEEDPLSLSLSLSPLGAAEGDPIMGEGGRPSGQT